MYPTNATNKSLNTPPFFFCFSFSYEFLDDSIALYWFCVLFRDMYYFMTSYAHLSIEALKEWIINVEFFNGCE